ncbi:MAG: hypothetical protein OXG29_05720 [Gammaproteobacteria bacterium]|nr:hypothetical protein [Gammaproteobacteria bacterium]
MMRPRPEPRVASFLDSIADEGHGHAVRRSTIMFRMRFSPRLPRPAVS